MKNTALDKEYEALYLEHWPLVLRICISILKDVDAAKDCAQDSFISLLQQLESKQIKDYQNWLTRVASNKCYYYIRKRNRGLVVAYAAAQERDIGVDHIEEASISYGLDNSDQDPLINDLKMAINQLKPLQKLCAEMFYFKQMTYRQISAEYNLSLRQVKSNLQSARRSLRLRMKSEGKFKM